MLTQEKAKALAEYLAKDEARAQKLMEMSAEDAAKAFTEDGIEVTAEELAVFGAAVEEVSKEQSGELDETALEGVAGGASTGISSAIIGIIKPYFPIRPFVPIKPIPSPRRWLC